MTLTIYEAFQYESTRDPTISDGVRNGFKVGHAWKNSITNRVFTCTSNTANAATWSRDNPTNDARTRLEKLGLLAGVSRYQNAAYAPTYEQPCNVTTGAASALPGFATTPWLWSNTSKNQAFVVGGGTPRTTSAGYMKLFSRTISGAEENTYGSVTFSCDADDVCIVVNPTQAAADNVRIIIDGRYHDLAGTTVATGSTQYIWLQFSTFFPAPNRNVRTICIEFERYCEFVGVYVDAVSTVQKPLNTGLKIWVAGDSYAGGSGVSVSNVDSFPSILGKFLGCPNTAGGGVGSTGYATNNAGAQTYMWERVTTDIVPFAPDIIVATAGYNDAGLSETAVKSGVTQFLSAVRSQSILKRVPVFITGVFGGARGPNNNTYNCEDYIAAAVSEFNDSYVFFIPVSRDPTGPWMFGTGYEGATNGTGNSDFLISSDGTHPSDYGHKVIAERLADGIINAIKDEIGYIHTTPLGMRPPPNQLRFGPFSTVTVASTMRVIPYGWTDITLNATNHEIIIDNGSAPLNAASVGYLRLIQGSPGSRFVPTWGSTTGLFRWITGTTGTLPPPSSGPILRTAVGEWDLFMISCRRSGTGTARTFIQHIGISSS